MDVLKLPDGSPYKSAIFDGDLCDVAGTDERFGDVAMSGLQAFLHARGCGTDITEEQRKQAMAACADNGHTYAPWAQVPLAVGAPYLELMNARRDCRRLDPETVPDSDFASEGHIQAAKRPRLLRYLLLRGLTGHSTAGDLQGERDGMDVVTDKPTTVTAWKRDELLAMVLKVWRYARLRPDVFPIIYDLPANADSVDALVQARKEYFNSVMDALPKPDCKQTTWERGLQSIARSGMARPASEDANIVVRTAVPTLEEDVVLRYLSGKGTAAASTDAERYLYRAHQRLSSTLRACHTSTLEYNRGTGEIHTCQQRAPEPPMNVRLHYAKMCVPASMRQLTYKCAVVLNVDVLGYECVSVQAATCECPLGEIGRCSHVATLLLVIHMIPQTALGPAGFHAQDISPTSAYCTWLRGSSTGEIFNSRPLREIRSSGIDDVVYAMKVRASVAIAKVRAVRNGEGAGDDEEPPVAPVINVAPRRKPSDPRMTAKERKQTGTRTYARATPGTSASVDRTRRIGTAGFVDTPANREWLANVMEQLSNLTGNTSAFAAPADALWQSA